MAAAGTTRRAGARRTTRDPNTTRDTLVDAALAVIERDGIHATTTRRIAAEADVPLGTVHYWFASKEALIDAVMTRLLDDMRQRLPARLQGSSPGDDLHIAYATVNEQSRERLLALFECVLYGPRQDPPSAATAALYSGYRETATGVISNWLTRTGADVPIGVDALARLIVAVFDGLSIARLAEGDADAAIDDALSALEYLLQSAGIAAPRP